MTSTNATVEPIVNKLTQLGADDLPELVRLARAANRVISATTGALVAATERVSERVDGRELSCDMCTQLRDTVGQLEEKVEAYMESEIALNRVNDTRREETVALQAQITALRAQITALQARLDCREASPAVGGEDTTPCDWSILVRITVSPPTTPEDMQMASHVVSKIMQAVCTGYTRAGEVQHKPDTSSVSSDGNDSPLNYSWQRLDGLVFPVPSNDREIQILHQFFKLCTQSTESACLTANEKAMSADRRKRRKMAE